METKNPFKELEPDVSCPPHLKDELMSEIDIIRDTMTVVEVYVGDLFDTLLAVLSPFHDPTLPA